MIAGTNFDCMTNPHLMDSAREICIHVDFHRLRQIPTMELGAEVFFTYKLHKSQGVNW